jgi:hypothetical protein
MIITTLEDEEVENEIEIPVCCFACMKSKYGWSNKQRKYVEDKIDKKEPIAVPADVNSEMLFGNFIKTVNV